MVHSKEYVSRSSEVVSREMGGEMLILVPTSNRLYTLNTVGRKIWESLDGKITIGGIVSMISDEFKIEKGTVQKDVIEFTDDLCAKEMAVISKKRG